MALDRKRYLAAVPLDWHLMPFEGRDVEQGDAPPSGSTEPQRRASMQRTAFSAFSAEIQQTLRPDSILERLQADRAILAAWRLQQAIDCERTAIANGLGADPAEHPLTLAAALHAETQAADDSLQSALAGLRQIRESTRATPTAASHASRIDERETSPPPSETTPEPAPFHWQDRLVFDDAVSVDSPVVKGTWITVSQVVNMIVDGATWSHILRSHPELSEEDIRICLAYATDEENTGDRRMFY